MGVRVDWSKRADYIARHTIELRWADEAINDGEAVWLRPDPASQSGQAVRVIGYSVSAGTLLTVILVNGEADPDEKPDGDWWGSNAWTANPRDRRIYGKDLR